MTAPLRFPRERACPASAPLWNAEVVPGGFLSPEERAQIRHHFAQWLAARGRPELAIADCGRPDWPGWQALAALLIAATLLLAITPGASALRPRARPTETARILRTAAPGGRR